MQFLKWSLLIGVFLTSSTLGYAFGDRFAKRVFYLKELLQSIKLLKTEVIMLANPLPIAFKNISEKTDGKIKMVYESILADLLTERIDIHHCFTKTSDILTNECFLKKEDVDIFCTLGKNIGTTDRIDQDKYFNYIIDELILAINDAKIEKDKNLKMYRSLGLLVGLGAIIILV